MAIARKPTLAAAPRGTSRRGYSLARREMLWGYAFISPWLIGLLAFTAGPILAVFYWSFTDYPILSESTWVGTENYRRIFTADEKFVRSLVNTAGFVLIRVPVHLTLAFVLSLLLNRPARGIGWFRTALYLPSMIPIVAMAVVWRILLDPRTGYVNYLGGLVGLPQVNWLTSAAWIKPVIIFISLFHVGVAMIIFLAGLGNVPEQLYEAASLDGANAWQKLWSVTLPMMTPVILFNVIIDIINSFQVFAYAFILSEGGPNDASLFYVLYIYRQAFQFFEMGYASALAAILFVIVLVLTAVLMRWSEGGVHMSGSRTEPVHLAPRPWLTPRRRRRLGTLLAFAALGAVAAVMLVPLYLMILVALRPTDRAFDYPPDLWFSAVTFANFPRALVDVMPFSLYFRNTVIIAVLVIVGDLLSCSLVAYGFARFRFPGRDLLFMVLLSTLLVPFIVRLVPLFVLFQRLHWIDTFLPLVVPAFFGTPFFIFLMRQFFLTIPSELIDAARIDGASELGIWWRIMLPLSKPVLIAVAIFAFQNTWNDFLGPLVFLRSPEVRTVILGLQSLLGVFIDWPLVMAVALAIVAPMILVFLVFQRFFVKGVAVTGIKG